MHFLKGSLFCKFPGVAELLIKVTASGRSAILH